MPVRVLIVEDDAGIRTLEKKILETEGYLVDVAGNGREALEYLSRVQYDCVITDVMMPDMDGYQLARHLKEGPDAAKYKSLPIIMVTAKDRPQDQALGFAAGAVTYLTKPFSKTMLLLSLRTVVKKAPEVRPAAVPSPPAPSPKGESSSRLSAPAKPVDPSAPRPAPPGSPAPSRPPPPKAPARAPDKDDSSWFQKLFGKK